MPGQRADPLTIRWRSTSIFLEDVSGRRLFHGAAGVSDRPRLAWAYPFHEYIPGDSRRPRRPKSDGRTGRIARSRGPPHSEGVTP